MIRELWASKTIIVSDGKRTYKDLSLELIRFVVNHTLYFVDSNIRTHTYNIKYFWTKAKCRIKKYRGIFVEALNLI